MGKPDLFAKRTLATQTEPLTHGAASWKEAPQIRLEHVQSDGILVIHDALYLKNLEPPWNLVDDSDEILVECKMQGDHVDRLDVLRMLLRRQAREVQRTELITKGQTPWTGSQTIWVTSGYLPAWAKLRYQPAHLATGCYRWANEHFTGLWIASNELPLRDELVPFLITRTGRPLQEFLRWAIEKKPWPWTRDLVRSLGMLGQEAYDYIKYEYPFEDEESKRNVQSWILAFVNDDPALQKKIVGEAVEEAIEATELREARDAVVRVLQLRKLDVRPEQLAQVEACTDLAMLHRWRDQAVTAASADEAFAIG